MTSEISAKNDEYKEGRKTKKRWKIFFRRCNNRKEIKTLKANHVLARWANVFMLSMELLKLNSLKRTFEVTHFLLIRHLINIKYGNTKGSSRRTYDSADDNAFNGLRAIAVPTLHSITQESSHEESDGKAKFLGWQFPRLFYTRDGLPNGSAIRKYDNLLNAFFVLIFYSSLFPLYVSRKKPNVRFTRKWIFAKLNSTAFGDDGIEGEPSFIYLTWSRRVNLWIYFSASRIRAIQRRNGCEIRRRI